MARRPLVASLLVAFGLYGAAGYAFYDFDRPVLNGAVRYEVRPDGRGGGSVRFHGDCVDYYVADWPQAWIAHDGIRDLLYAHGFHPVKLAVLLARGEAGGADGEYHVPDLAAAADHENCGNRCDGMESLIRNRYLGRYREAGRGNAPL